MARIIILSFFVLIGTSSFGQLSKKEVLENKVKSVAEWETDLRSKRNKPIQESFTRYDLQGNTLETIERDNDGLITLHESYEYDAAGNKTVETQFDTDGSIKKKHVYSYFNGLRSKRMTYDRKGNLIGEKKYIYEFQDK